ncbi:MAG: endonuclease domain-containing protein [Chloroflexi bacterium]|nr:endonuclease domain-containing protein [Chloroflexota bacterium]
MKHIKYTKYQLRHLARDMRNNPTNAERVLWYHLRMNRLDGYRFLRQKVVGNAIVDFVCPKANLVIELDGGQHNENSYADDARTRRLNRSGYRVIRFWNHEVTNNIEGVIHTIRQALRD